MHMCNFKGVSCYWFIDEHWFYSQNYNTAHDIEMSVNISIKVKLIGSPISTSKCISLMVLRETFRSWFYSQNHITQNMILKCKRLIFNEYTIIVYYWTVLGYLVQISYRLLEIVQATS